MEKYLANVSPSGTGSVARNPRFWSRLFIGATTVALTLTLATAGHCKPGGGPPDGVGGGPPDGVGGGPPDGVGGGPPGGTGGGPGDLPDQAGGPNNPGGQGGGPGGGG